MTRKKAASALFDCSQYELPPVSKWHKPAVNRVVEVFGSWAQVEIWPGVVIKLDIGDLRDVMKLRWNLKRGRSQGTLIVNGSLINGRRGNITLQKFLLSSSGQDYIYFKSADRLDFRRENLEIRDPRLRSIKQRKRSTPTTSIFRGVSLVTKTKKWSAQICINQHSIALGTYESEIEAALAYNRASRLYFGNEGYQNETSSLKLKAKLK